MPALQHHQHHQHPLKRTFRMLVSSQRRKTLQGRNKQVSATVATSKQSENGTPTALFDKDDASTIPQLTPTVSIIHCSNAEVLSSMEASLPSDVQISVMSFLDIHSVRQLMNCNRRFRSVLTSDAAHNLWLAHCQSKWRTATESTTFSLVEDNLNLPTAATDPSSSTTFARFNSVNLPLLLCRTPTYLPTQVDESILPTAGAVDTDISSSVIQVVERDDETGKIVSFRYSGKVGSNQVNSIRSDHPLPRPTLLSSSHYSYKRSKSKKLFSLKRKSQKHQKWSPFVAPFRTVAAENVINVTPRLVSYFEASISKLPQETKSRPNPLLLEAEGSYVQDCIVIGLATDNFDCCQSAVSLPGWNSASFGYHSDNGGLYHGSGRMQKRAGAFGPGDTVGMGIDYASGGIFVTKNGKFLDFGWVDLKYYLEETKQLYPVIGIDSKDVVQVNYGGGFSEKPFQFDLAAYCCRQQQENVHCKSSGIAMRYQFLSTTTSTIP